MFKRNMFFEIFQLIVLSEFISYNNIQQGMSYFVCNQNLLQSISLSSPLEIPQNLQKKLSILPILTEALKVSLTSYSPIFYAQIQEKAQLLKNQQKNYDRLSSFVEIDVQSMETDRKNQNSKENHREKTFQQISLPKLEDDKKEEHLSQNITSEEIASDNGYIETSQRKKFNKYSKIPKISNKSDEISQNLKYRYPKLDVLDGAYIQNKPLSIFQIEKRKEHLLLRKVENWGEKTKHLFGKREIRMLNQ